MLYLTRSDYSRGEQILPCYYCIDYRVEQNGRHIYRKCKEIQNAFMKRTIRKLASAESLTSAMDEVDYLQVYVHDFEEWDGGSAIPTTFTPLTINDVDVTELTMYDSLGSNYALEVDTIPPDYPLIVVGLNENMSCYSDDDSTISTAIALPTIPAPNTTTRCILNFP